MLYVGVLHKGDATAEEANLLGPINCKALLDGFSARHSQEDFKVQKLERTDNPHYLFSALMIVAISQVQACVQNPY